MPKPNLPDKKDLLYRLVFGRLHQGDIEAARIWRDEDPEAAPIWVNVISGSSPEKLEFSQEIAQEELARDLLESLGIEVKNE